jgi:hypothetical protein
MEGPHERAECTHLEALGRLLAGIAPWLELGPDATDEGKLRGRFIALAVRAVAHAVDPESPDYLNFNQGTQPLVDAAFLAHGLLRAPRQLWNNLDETTRNRVVKALRSSRVITPSRNNWLLFSAMVETALWKFTGESRCCSMSRGSARRKSIRSARTIRCCWNAPGVTRRCRSG